MVRTALVAWLLLTAQAHAQGTPPSPPPASTEGVDKAEEAALAAKLDLARTEIRNGNPQAALDQYIEPVLALYTARFEDSKRGVYTAESAKQALAYMLLAAALKMDGITVGRVWADAHYLKVSTLVDLGRINEAEAAYKDLLTLSQYDAMALLELGNIAQWRKQRPQALDRHNQAFTAADLDAELRKAVMEARAIRGCGFSLYYRDALRLDRNDNTPKAELDYIRQQRRAAKGAPTG